MVLLTFTTGHALTGACLGPCTFTVSFHCRQLHHMKSCRSFLAETVPYALRRLKRGLEKLFVKSIFNPSMGLHDLHGHGVEVSPWEDLSTASPVVAMSTEC